MELAIILFTILYGVALFALPVLASILMEKFEKRYGSAIPSVRTIQEDRARMHDAYWERLWYMAVGGFVTSIALLVIHHI